MQGIWKISDAASLAFHTMAHLASQKESRPVSAKEIATRYRVSEAHLSKVIQRLAHSGLVKTVRGPGGGVILSKSPDKITLLQVYEALEGPLPESNCMLGVPKCGRKSCILGDLLGSLNKQVREHLQGTKLSEFVYKTNISKRGGHYEG